MKHQRLLCGIFGFYLTLALIAAQLAIACFGGYLDKSALVDRLCNGEIVRSTLEQLQAKGEQTAKISGLPVSIYDGVYTFEQLQAEMKAVFSDVLNGKKTYIDPYRSMMRLKDNIRAALLEMEGVESTLPYEYNINRLYTQELATYRAAVKPSIYGMMHSFTNSVRKWSIILGAAGAVLALICIVLLAVCTKNLGAVLRELSFSAFAAGAVVTVLTTAVLRTNALNRIPVSPAAYQNAIAAHLESGFSLAQIIGAFTLPIAVLLFAIAAIAIHQTNKHPSNKDF